MLKWLLVSTSFILALVVSPPAYAAEDTTRAFELKVQGVDGVWFPAGMAKEIQADVEELRRLRPVLADQERLLGHRLERLEVKDARILQVKEALDLSMQAEERTKSVVEAAVRGQRQAEEDLDAWHRSPALWVGVGVVATVLLEVAALALFNALDSK